MTLPQDPEAELCLIGFCMESIEAFDAARNVIQERGDVFSNQFLGNVWVSMCSIVSRNDRIDILSIRNAMQKGGHWREDGHDMLSSCLSAASGNRGENAESVACLIMEMSMRRTMIESCSKFIQLAYSGDSDVEQIIGELQASLSRIDGVTVKETGGWLRDLAPASLETIEQQQARMKESGNAIFGQPTGIELLDAKTGGDKPGELITWAARPGGGKSVVAVNGAIAGAIAGYPQAIISLEQDNDMQVRRIFADIASIPNHILQQSKLGGREWEQVNRTMDKVCGLPIYLDFIPGLDINRLVSLIRKLVRMGVKRVYIDYLQLMSDPPEPSGKGRREAFNNNDRIGRITKRLKQLAGELGIPIVLLSQMSRDIEKRPGEKIPQLSDLRESGNIEQDSNSVFFLYSPIEYEQAIKGYCAKFYPGMGISDMQRLSFVVIAKQRNGQKMPVPFWFDRKFCRMTDIRDMTTFRALSLEELFADIPEYAERMGVQLDLFGVSGTDKVAAEEDDPFPF